MSSETKYLCDGIESAMESNYRQDSSSPFVHPTADVQTDDIGPNTKIWQYVVVLPGARIGANCNINAHCFVEGGVTIGDNVTVKSGVYLWSGTIVEDDVFIGPNATFANDKYPRSKRYPQQFVGVTLKRGASVGANATLLPGVEVGQGAMVGAGAVVTRNVSPNSVVVGNPARPIRNIENNQVS